MGPYSDKAHNLGLYPKITLLLVLHSACLHGRLGWGFSSLKITICDIKKFGIFFSPKKLAKVVEVILEKENLFPKKIPIFLENKIKI